MKKLLSLLLCILLLAGCAPAVYDGPTEFTPTSEPQTIATSGRSLRTDLTVNPIPSNYGLVTWNGSVLTVS